MPKRVAKIRDAATEVSFVRLPGGTIDLGLQEEEAAELCTLIPNARDRKEALAAMARSRTATIAPFLVSKAPLSGGTIAQVAHDFDTVGDRFARVNARNAARAVEALGYRRSKTPAVARSLAWATYKYPHEIVAQYIENAHTRKRARRAALFALDAT